MNSRKAVISSAHHIPIIRPDHPAESGALKSMPR
jgi:hypothetical protein